MTTFEWNEINLRVYANIKAEWKRCAEAAGLTLSAWIRQACEEKQRRDAVRIQTPEVRVSAETCPRHNLKHCVTCRWGRYA